MSMRFSRTQGRAIAVCFLGSMTDHGCLLSCSCKAIYALFGDITGYYQATFSGKTFPPINIFEKKVLNVFWKLVYSLRNIQNTLLMFVWKISVVLDRKF